MNTDPASRLPLHRRTILKGMGATLALPWLESLAWATGGDAAVAAGPPKRWAALIFANGVVPDRWWAKETPAGLDLCDVLQPLAPHQQNLVFFENLRLVKDPPFKAPHGTHFCNLLSGAPVQRGSVPKLATSLDHYLAQIVGRDTVLPVLNLGCRAGNIRGVNLSTINWSSPTTPVIPESYPRQAFDRLFDVTSKAEDQSILDDVLGQVHAVRRRLDAADQAKLDEYTDSVRQVESQIDRAIKNTRPPGAWKPTLGEPDMERPEEGWPEAVPDYMRLMMDLILLSFRMDKTRIATLTFNNDGVNYMKFGFLDGLPNMEHHGISHHGGNPQRIEHHCRTIQYHAEQLAYFLDRMKSIDEGGVSMLDNSSILFGTNFIDGHHHTVDSVPLIAAGGKNTIRGGRVISAQREMDRPACNLYLSMARVMGVEVDQFGDSYRAFDLV